MQNIEINKQYIGIDGNTYDVFGSYALVENIYQVRNVKDGTVTSVMKDFLKEKIEKKPCPHCISLSIAIAEFLSLGWLYCPVCGVKLPNGNPR